MATFEFTLDREGIYPIPGDFSETARPGDQIIVFAAMSPTPDIYAFVDTGLGHTWTCRGLKGDWTLKMLTFDSQSNMWCVGEGGDVGQWTGSWNDSNGGWKKVDNMGHSLEMIGFGADGRLWCVHDQTKAGYWNTSGKQWFDEGWMAGWWFKMLAFGRDNSMWCVGSGGNLGELSHPGPDQWCWIDHGCPSGKTLCWVTFDASGLLWCVTDQKDIYTWSRNGAWTSMGSMGGLDPAVIVFTPDPKQTWCVDKQYNVVQWNDASESLAGQTIEANKLYTIPQTVTPGLYYLTTTPFPIVRSDGRKRDTANGKLNVGSGNGK